MTLNKPPSGHCGLKVQPLEGWCRVPYGGEGMLDGSKQGSGATLIITRGVQRHKYSLVFPKILFKAGGRREYMELSGPKSIVDCDVAGEEHFRRLITSRPYGRLHLDLGCFSLYDNLGNTKHCKMKHYFY